MAKNEKHIIFVAKDKGTFLSLHKMLKFIGKKECSKSNKELKITLPHENKVNEGIIRWCKFNNVDVDYDFDVSCESMSA
jgi:hypothetical protein